MQQTNDTGTEPGGPPVTADSNAFDIAVVGGGPAGLSAALWAARYRRRVVVIDASEQRNRWSAAAHGYLGLDGASPEEMLRAARRDVDRHPEIQVVDGARVVAAARDGDGGFQLEVELGTNRGADRRRRIRALRVVLATGVRDVFPDVARFEEFFGRSIVTCPSCDGYEARGRRVAVVGESPEMAEFAIGLLDWAGSVITVRQGTTASSPNEAARRELAVDDVEGRVVAIEGDDGEVTALRLDSGRSVPCDIVFWLMGHEPQSDLGRRLGCATTPEGCIEVDGSCQTSVPHVYAAGDMTPGPHLVQVAAAEGAKAGIAAATSLRGHAGAPLSATPAPDSAGFVDGPAVP